MSEAGGPCGTIVLQPGQEDAPIYGRRVRVLYRQIDGAPGMAGVRCKILDGPVTDDKVGIRVADVKWDDEPAMRAWLADHPAPAPRKGRRRLGRPANE